MKKDINNLIEELTKVNPSNLSEEGLKLFNKINGIIDRNKELEEKNSLLTQQNITYKRNIHDLKNKNIPVSLVEEKIEELQKELEEKYSAEKISVFSGNTYMEKFKLLGKVQVLQELLEKRK